MSSRFDAAAPRHRRRRAAFQRRGAADLLGGVLMPIKRKHVARVVSMSLARRKDGMVGFARNWHPLSFGGELDADRTCYWTYCEERSTRGNYCAEHALVMYAAKKGAADDD